MSTKMIRYDTMWARFSRKIFQSMKKIPHLGLRFPVYLWLVGIYPILFLYSANHGSVDDQEVFAALIGMLAATTVVFGLSDRLTVNIHKSALILGICSAFFSLSGHVYMLVFMPKSLGVWTLIELLALAAIAYTLYRIRSKTFFVHATRVLNLILTCMVLLQVYSIVSSHISLSRYDDLTVGVIAQHQPAANVKKVNDSPTRPDIYFIVPDSYPSDAFLLQAMDYDNSAFTQALRERGFVVVDHAQSNYGVTLLSVATAANMRYHSSNTSALKDKDFLQVQIANSAVARYLLDLGYTYVHLMNGWNTPSSIADINREFAPQGATDFRIAHSSEAEGRFAAAQVADIETRHLNGSEKQPFFSLYIDTTMLRLAASLLSRVWQFVDNTTPYQWKTAEMFLAMTDEVENIVAMPEATFTYIHLLKPHLPVTFNERGEIIKRTFSPTPEEYFAELKYINSKFLQMFDYILKRSKNPPVIVFLADHGSIYGYGRRRTPNSDTFGRTLFDVYAGIYLPSSYSLEVPRPFTLVNAFALILNAVFETEFEQQEDRLFELPVGYDELFYQIDVTDEFKNWR